MRKNFVVLFLVLVFMVVGAMVTNFAFAAPAITFTNPKSGNEISNVTTLAGWQFTVNSNVTVNSLGFYDEDNLYGTNWSHEVGIYDVTTQALVVSGVVTPSGTYNSWFMWTSVTPTALTAGNTYDIVAFVGSDMRTWDPDGFTVNPNITYVRNVWANSATSLQFPNSTDTNANGYFGPNFGIAASSVPEPATMLLLGLGLVGLAGAKRKLNK